MIAMRRTQHRLILAVATTALAASVQVAPLLAAPVEPLHAPNFTPAAPRGFGNPANGSAWSMAWYKGKLYVGTHPNAACAQKATLAYYSNTPALYPPGDPGIDCTLKVEDLDLRAEIWCWDPATDQWTMVYRSPEDLMIPGVPGKFVARDTGYRDMLVFTEPDGTEALYVSGFTARDFHRGLPPPRILRSVDGRTFKPIPMDPGTLLGDLDMREGITLSGFNRMFVYEGRFFAALGGNYGHAFLMESERPWEGNDSYRFVAPPGMMITAVASFNGSLYVAEGAQPIEGNPPFRILKTKATGEEPYTFTEVIPEGGYFGDGYSTTVVKMFVYGGRLWAGTNRPTELYRINPDDTWDIAVGPARATPVGMKYPLSGMTTGFDWAFTIHVHDMEEHDGWLYLGTNDYGNQNPWRYMDNLVQQTGARFGFDLYRTRNGHYLHEITLNGLEGISSDYSARNLLSTPEGMFIGTINSHQGCAIWQGQSGPIQAQPPTQLEIEPWLMGCLLHWLPSPDAVRYHIVASTWETAHRYQTVASTTQTAFGFPFVLQQNVHVAVVAENSRGQFSPASNVVPWLSYNPPMTFSRLLQTTQQWNAHPTLRHTIATAQQLASAQQYENAIQTLTAAKTLAAQNPSYMAPWQKEDFLVLTDKLIRRLDLAQQGLIGFLGLF